MKPLIGITMGDPGGIGPEIVLKSLFKKRLHRKARYLIFGDFEVLERYRKPLKWARIHLDDMRLARQRQLFNQPVSVLDFQKIKKNLHLGRFDVRYGKASLDYLSHAVRMAKRGVLDALITCPINKQSIQKAIHSRKIIGHTEFLAQKTKTKKVALMMVYENLRAVHVTSHVPLRDVHRFVTKRRVFDVIELAAEGLKRIGIHKPRMAVCGLNPHSGERGKLGKEEIREIGPAIRLAQRKGYDVKGPFSGDVIWSKVRDKEFDVGIAMYHDQGQIPIKLAGFHFRKKKKSKIQGVNVTLGLPFIRTSVDHGTAYDIAGKGVASEGSLVNAIELAHRMIQK